MNDDTSRSRWRGLPRQVGILIGAAGIALLAAACGGGSSAGGSGGSAGTPGGSSSAGSPATQQNTLSWAECMRSHGVNVPGSMPSPAASSTGKPVKVSGPVVNPNSPQYHAALRACQPLQPGGSRVGG